MTEYRNKLTGVVITVESEISGDNWEPVVVPSVSAEKDEPKTATKKRTKK